MPPAASLLAWYDRHRRELPWRVAEPDPYRVWLSEVMLQQTTVAAVGPRFERFLQRFPTVQALAGAPEAAVMEEWAGLGYYARARNLHACARAVAAAGGFPRNAEGLRALPGIGVWTSAEIRQRAHGDPDAVSVGDYHIPGIVGWALTGRKTDDAGMLRLLAPYRGHRYRVTRLLELDGHRPPPRGPRMPARDYRSF